MFTHVLLGRFRVLAYESLRVLLDKGWFYKEVFFKKRQFIFGVVVVPQLPVGFREYKISFFCI